MPTPPSDKQTVCFRLARSGIVYLDRIAAAEGVDRTEIARRALTEYTSRWVGEHGEPPALSGKARR